MSKRTMRRLFAFPTLVVAIAGSACSVARHPVLTAQPSAAERLAAVDQEVRAGCLDCLFDAYARFDELRRDPATAVEATAGAIRSAALIALRERELGMVDDGYMDVAKRLAADTPDVPVWLGPVLEAVDALPRNSAGLVPPVMTDADIDRMRRLRANRDRWLTVLRESARFDELAAYTLLAFACDSVDTRDIGHEELAADVDAFAETPLVIYRESLCRRIEATTLEPLRASNPRFVEIAYSLGLSDLGARPRPKLDEADALLQQAYTWHPKWPSLTLAVGGLAMTAEDFERARAAYEETLALAPASPDAQLGLARALTYLARYEEAIAAADRLIHDGWYVGEALYWRAFNNLQLSRLDAAWDDIEHAAKVLINADVPRLAGLIAYRRDDLETAIARFTTSRERNPADCETQFYLGVVHAEMRHWSDAAGILTSAATCLEQAEQDLRQQVEGLRVSDLAPDRRARQIARREQQIADGRRRIATSWFDCAVAYFSLSRRDEARQFAEKVADDEQFGARAKEILSRLR